MAQYELIKEKDQFLVSKDSDKQSYKITYDSLLGALNEDLEVKGDLFVEVIGDTMTGDLVMGLDTDSVGADLIVEEGDIVYKNFSEKVPNSYADRKENKYVLLDNEGKVISAEQPEFDIIHPGNDTNDAFKLRILDAISIPTDASEISTTLADGFYSDVPMYDNTGLVLDPTDSIDVARTIPDGFDATFDIEVEGGKLVSAAIHNPGHHFSLKTTPGLDNIIEIDTSALTGGDTRSNGPAVIAESITNNYASTDVVLSFGSESAWIKNTEVKFTTGNASTLDIQKVGNRTIQLTVIPTPVDDLEIVYETDIAPDVNTADRPFWFNTKEGRLYMLYTNNRPRVPEDGADTSGGSGIVQEKIWIEANPNALMGEAFINKTDGICASIHASDEVSANHFAIEKLPVLP